MGACLPLEVAKAALKVAALPLEACDVHQGAIDGAEIEATFENVLTLLALNTKIWEKQIEDNLLSCRQVVGLILPEANGGQAEWVSELIKKRIDDFELAVADADRVDSARRKLAAGDTLFAAGRYQKAYKKYCNAYRALIKNDDDSS